MKRGVNWYEVGLQLAVAPSDVAEPKVEPFKPRWVHVAYEGNWKGYRTGEFTFTPDTLREMVGNLRKSPQYKPNSATVTAEEIRSGEYGVVRFDWRHLSEMNPAEVLMDNQIAMGWVLEAEVRMPNQAGDASGLKASSDKAELWAFGYFTPKAAEMINNHEVKWLSITAYPNSKDKVSAQNIGWYMSSIALTPQPFLDDLTALPFQAENQSGATEATQEGTKQMFAKKVTKACLEFLGISEDADDGMMQHALETMMANHKAMKAKCDAYEGQFGALKKTCGIDASNDQVGAVLADQFSAVKKVVGGENLQLVQLGVAIAEWKTKAADYDREKPQYKIMLETGVADEKQSAEADIDRVLAEKNWGAEMRDVVACYRKGTVTDEQLTSPEALQKRQQHRKAFLEKWPPTGAASVLLDYGLNGRNGTHVEVGTGAGASGTTTANGVGIQNGRHSTQTTKRTIMLTDENRQQKEVDLRSFAEPGKDFDPIQCAVTALRVNHPTKYGKVTFGSEAYNALFMEANDLVRAAHTAGAI